jgi:hypothetical protein
MDVAQTLRKNAAYSLTATTRATDDGMAAVRGGTASAEVSLIGRAVAIGGSATSMTVDSFVLVDLIAFEASMEEIASTGAAGGLGLAGSVDNSFRAILNPNSKLFSYNRYSLT